MSAPSYPPRRGRRRYVAAGFAILVPLAIASWVRFQVVTPLRLPREGVTVRIEPGWSMRVVADHLARRGVVHHAWPVAAVARWRGVDREIHPGDFRFRGTVTIDDVLRELESPLAALQLVTIPEGRTAAEVTSILEADGLGGSDVFDCVARSPQWLLELDLPSTGVEGYLFPDTYAFSRSAPPGRMLRYMVERFRDETGHLTEAREAMGMTVHDMVTLASMIEKETGADAERPLISAVFHNRLRLGMPLQSDPTVVYDRPDFHGPITRADLQHPSPYNTYQHVGLPPGPICNPGLAALDAAVHPAQVNYLYFVSRNDGTHEFSTTLADHQRAVARYRRRSNGA